MLPSVLTRGGPPLGVSATGHSDGNASVGHDDEGTKHMDGTATEVRSAPLRKPHMASVCDSPRRSYP